MSDSFEKKLKIFNKIMIIIITTFLIIACVIFIINGYVKKSVNEQIYDKAEEIENVDCAIVLGASIWGNNPSPMLETRLERAVELYNDNKVTKILMSGDHGTTEHDEVNIMKKYAIEKGVPSEDVFMDHAGFSTYDSIYRAKEIFGVKKAIIITQRYHLYRALFIANRLDIEAYGIEAEDFNYGNAARYRRVREVFARNKDFFKCIIKPTSKLLGDKIDINGDGNQTND